MFRANPPGKETTNSDTSPPTKVHIYIYVYTSSVTRGADKEAYMSIDIPNAEKQSHPQKR